MPAAPTPLLRIAGLFPRSITVRFSPDGRVKPGLIAEGSITYPLSMNKSENIRTEDALDASLPCRDVATRFLEHLETDRDDSPNTIRKMFKRALAAAGLDPTLSPPFHAPYLCHEPHGGRRRPSQHPRHARPRQHVDY